LLDSLPSGEAPLRGIPGDVPNLVAASAGCRFHPRCPRATQICGVARPLMTQPGPGHWVRCHHGLLG
jgi:peptide/nickel transport system ATP-binding protein